MTPLFGMDGSASVLDLRTTPSGDDPVAPWRRRLYAVLLVLVVVGTAAAFVAELVMAVVPSRYAFDLAIRDGRAVVTETETPRLAEGDVVLALAGQTISNDDDVKAVVARRVGSVFEAGPLEVVVASDDGPRRVEVPLERQSAADAVENVVFFLPLLLMGWLGLLALGARAREPSAERFVHLCLVGGLGFGVFIGGYTALRVLSPVADLGMVPDWWGVLAIVLPFAFGYALLRFLQVFPESAPEPDERETVPTVPRTVTVLVLIGLGAAVAGTVWAILTPSDAAYARRVLTVLQAITGLTTIPTLVLYLPYWLVQVTVRVLRVLRRRARETDDPEAARRVRLAILGLRGGTWCFAVLLTLGGTAVAVELVEVFIELPLANALMDSKFFDVTGTLAIFGGLALPFAGVGLAVMRKGLWDVDLLAARTAFVSVLGAAFVVVWAVADEAVEAMVPGGLAAAGPVIAGLTVAGIQGPLSGWLRRRFGSSGEALPDALARASQRLGSSSDDPAAVLGRALAEEVGATPVAVVTPSSSRAAVAWSSPDWEGLPEPVLDRVLDALESDPAVPVRTDAGPFLAAGIGRDPVRAAVLLGPRNGALYGRDERKMIAVMLGPTAHLFAGPARPEPQHP